MVKFRVQVMVEAMVEAEMIRVLAMGRHGVQVLALLRQVVAVAVAVAKALSPPIQ
jgi:malate/lactate dehydrogenase